MLYKFKSKATGDLIMLQANGQRVLQIIGKDSAAPQGIVLPEQMVAAIAALQNAFVAEEAEQQEAIAQAKVNGQATPVFDLLSLRKRATPLVEMLQRCLRENAEITWGT